VNSIGDRIGSCVSVVIPCFNDGHIVGAAVESARAEGIDEIVIVDDGSNDPATLEVLIDLAATGVRVERKANGGLASARTHGLRVVATEYVFVLDADDQIAPGALVPMLTAMESDPDLGVVWGDVRRIGSAGPLLYRKGDVLDPWRITFVNELVASTLVRRSTILAAGGWTLDDAFEDWDLWMTLAERGVRGRRIDCVSLLYRVDDPRMYRKALNRFDELSALLQLRHSTLFCSRSVHRRGASAPRRLKVLWTAIASMPFAERRKRYLYAASLAIAQPSRRRRRVRR
jgi:glycosyltransferase involved in cell wall biosynthesis